MDLFSEDGPSNQFIETYRKKVPLFLFTSVFMVQEQSLMDFNYSSASICLEDTFWHFLDELIVTVILIAMPSLLSDC